MKFVHYESLKPAARQAFDAGNGQRHGFRIDGDYIAVVGKDGRALDWVRVLRPNPQFSAITEEPQS